MNTLGFQVVISEETNNQTVKKSLEPDSTETCFPVEVMHGHVDESVEKDVDYIFTPFIVNAKAEKDNPTNNCNCPWIQAFPFMVNAALGDKEKREIDDPNSYISGISESY